jgi:glutamate/aspartate transport system permease protein
MNYNWNWGIFLELSPEGTGSYLKLMLWGLQTTVVTSALAWLLAFSLGTLFGVLRSLPSRTARIIGDVYVEAFRNVPLLMQLFLWYFVLPELLPSDVGRWIKSLPNAPFYTAVVGIGCYMGARVSEQIRAGIQSLPRGQLLAGTALGLTTAQSYRFVILPNVFRTMLPPLTSELLNTIKNTSVALTIGLIELTARARAMQEFSFQVFESFIAATLLYVLLNLVVTYAMRGLERRIALPGLHGAK